MAAEQPDDYAHLTPLFDELTDPATPEPTKQAAREELVSGYLDVAAHIAQRFAQRGEPYEDLLQVARLALVKAVDRFDPARGTEFLPFAVPTITGEIRKYFRDHCWAMRVPRRLQELRGAVNDAAARLSQQLGRAPKPSELAVEMDISVEQVREGLQAGEAYKLSSLDRPASGDEESADSPGNENAGTEDSAFSYVDDREQLSTALARLPERERTIVGMRFFRQMTQSQIANDMGLSQMHVSRLLSRSIATLRDVLTEDEGERPGRTSA